MDRAFSSGASGSPPAAPASPSTGYATSGNPATSTPATKPGAYWYHMITEELLTIIASAGITNDKSVLTQVASAIQSGKLFSSAAAGTADALTAGFTPVIATLKDGMALHIRAAQANTTTTPTFTPNSGTIAAKTILKGNGLALVAGDIAGAGHWIDLQYDLTLDKWVLLNPATGVSIVPAASTSVSGKVQLATAAEAQAGTDALKAITPSTLLNALKGSNQSLAANGYQKLPGGLIIQWGATGSIAADTNSVITLPVAFPTAFLSVLANPVSSVASTFSSSLQAATTTTFTIRQSPGGVNASALLWIALGY